MLTPPPVNYVFPPDLVEGDNRHPSHTAMNGGTAFNLSRYPAIASAFDPATPNNSADLSTTNEQGIDVAVGWARPQTSMVDWLLLVEQGHDEAWQPITQLRKILLACVFGTIGFIMILVLPAAHIGVLPISRLKEATMASVSPLGEDDDSSQESLSNLGDDGCVDEENAHGSSRSKRKSGFIVKMLDLTRRKGRASQGDRAENARRRAFKIPAKVQDKKHFITEYDTKAIETSNDSLTNLCIVN